jgi:hypothetical protein
MNLFLTTLRQGSDVMLTRSRATVPLMLLILLALVCLLLARVDAAALDESAVTVPVAGAAWLTSHDAPIAHLLLNPPAGDPAACLLKLSPAGWAGWPEIAPARSRGSFE